MRHDLVIRNADVATASDRFKADIGILDGRIVALANRLPAAAEEIDAEGLLVLPGGVDSHCHIDQRSILGPEPGGDDRHRPAARPDGLHALSGDDRQGLACDGALARRGHLPRRSAGR